MDLANSNCSDSDKQYSRKFPSFCQLRQLLKVLNKKEKIIFFICFFFFIISSFSLCFIFYFKKTTIQPVEGGSFIEGINTAISGSPLFINPIYASSDIDRDLVELIYSGLMKYDSQGNIIPDLAQKYEIKEEGKVIEVYLKENISWSDGAPLTADDVIFTIKVIQNPDYKSVFWAKWIGIEVEKISDFGIKFSLKNPSPFFLENLTLKIIPKHIWEKFGPENFSLSIYNLKPIGSGPYKLKEIKQDKKGKIIKIELVRNQLFYEKKPYLSQISFYFYDSNENLIKAALKKDVQAFLITDYQDLNKIPKSDFQIINFSFPRYFAVFFNPEKLEFLADKKIRQAINYATDKNELIEKILLGYGKEVSSPILPEIYGFSLPTNNYSFNLDLAKKILQEEGFLEKENGLREKIIKKEVSFQLKSDLKEGAKGKEVEALQECLKKDLETLFQGKINGEFDSETKKAVIKFQEKYAKDILEPFGLTQGTGIVSAATRKKLNEICFSDEIKSLTLKITLVTIDQPLLIQTANLLKEQWKKIGLELEIKILESSSLELKEMIRKKDYEALLYGEILNIPPDPFPFWHSSQKKEPGFNLANYQNKEADKILEKIRQTLDDKERKEKLENFQNILIEDAPVVFLFNPDFIYVVSKDIKGINQGLLENGPKRFSSVKNWYLKTKRCFNFNK